VKLHKGLEFRN
jgi:hypothetical protein